MTAPLYSSAVKYYSENPIGNDYVIGDIHGRFDLVVEAIKKVKFNEKKDRLFCVGDLIDRGPYSNSVLEFLSLPFVHAIRGNHEDMLLEIYENHPPTQKELEEYAQHNGLEWWLDVTEIRKEIILEQLKELPLVAEIETPRGNVGLVHADIPQGMDWETFKLALELGDEKVQAQALWGRTRLDYNICEEIPGVGRVYVGHTVQNNIRKLGNVYAIDTGAVFNNHLTLVNISFSTQILNRLSAPQDNLHIINPKERLYSLFGTSPKF